MHMIAGEINLDTLKKGILYYTLTGKTGEAITEVRQFSVSALVSMCTAGITLCAFVLNKFAYFFSFSSHNR